MFFGADTEPILIVIEYEKHKDNRKREIYTRRERRSVEDCTASSFEINEVIGILPHQTARSAEAFPGEEDLIRRTT